MPNGGRRACELRREEGEGGGGQRRGVSQMSRRIVGCAGEARGGRRRLEGGGYSAGAHCSALQSAQMAGMAIFYACGHGQRCLVVLGGSKEVGDGLGCPGWPLGEERGRRRGRNGQSKEIKWGFTHPIIELWVCHCYWG